MHFFVVVVVVDHNAMWSYGFQNDIYFDEKEKQQQTTAEKYFSF